MRRRLKAVSVHVLVTTDSNFNCNICCSIFCIFLLCIFGYVWIVFIAMKEESFTCYVFYYLKTYKIPTQDLCPSLSSFAFSVHPLSLNGTPTDMNPLSGGLHFSSTFIYSKQVVVLKKHQNRSFYALFIKICRTSTHFSRHYPIRRPPDVLISQQSNRFLHARLRFCRNVTSADRLIKSVTTSKAGYKPPAKKNRSKTPCQNHSPATMSHRTQPPIRDRVTL